MDPKIIPIDIWRILCQYIDDPPDIFAFALICKRSARVIKEISIKQRNQILRIAKNKLRYKFSRYYAGYILYKYDFFDKHFIGEFKIWYDSNFKKIKTRGFYDLNGMKHGVWINISTRGERFEESWKNGKKRIKKSGGHNTPCGFGYNRTKKGSSNFEPTQKNHRFNKKFPCY